MLYVGIGDSHFDVLNVWSNANDVVDDRLFEAESRNDHAPGFWSQIVEASQDERHFSATFLKYAKS